MVGICTETDGEEVVDTGTDGEVVVDALIEGDIVIVSDCIEELVNETLLVTLVDDV